MIDVVETIYFIFLQNTHVLRDFQRKKAQRRQYLLSQHQKYAKQKQEEDENAKLAVGDDSNVDDGKEGEKEDDNDSQPADSTTKIKIHRKRTRQQAIDLSNSSEALQEKGIGNENTNKKEEQGSVPDLLEVGMDGEISSSEKGRGKIARKLTFGHEVMDQYHKGQ